MLEMSFGMANPLMSVLNEDGRSEPLTIYPLSTFNLENQADPSIYPWVFASLESLYEDIFGSLAGCSTDRNFRFMPELSLLQWVSFPWIWHRDGKRSKWVSVCQNIGWVIHILLPCSHFVPLTTEYLNKALASPRKNNQTNRLVTGTLQLVSRTYLIIDENQWKMGLKNSTGNHKVQIFRNMLELQKVEYDFQYYTMDMPTAIQVLLWDGKSSMFPADVVLSYRPTSDAHQMQVP